MGPSRSFFDSAAGRAIGRLIHAATLRQQKRSQSLATALFRNINQVSAFEGPLADLPAAGAMNLLVAGCSIGCEAYTLAGYLAARFPTLTFAVEAFDIDPGAIEQAKAALYGPQHLNEAVFAGPFADVARRLLVRDGANWRIEPDVARRLNFSIDDALAERPDQADRYDAVLAQNFMVHMDDSLAAKVLANLAARLRPGGAMFIGGMGLDMRTAATRAVGLAPVDWRVTEVHDEDHVRRNAWPFAYWSLEPYDDARPDHLRRYATIFRKEV